ncbi:cation:proton antiporter [Halobacteria archaeon AArc-dxtr1]|nr:cation:proton antiporter [Halobacteria archaeon AArc-dxtr1]
MTAIPSLPAEDPLLIFGLAMLVFLIAPLVLGRYRLPGIVGIILVGAVIGENGVGLLARDETIVLLGEVGLVYLLFVAGLEINLNQFLEETDRSVVFGLASFLIPQIVGTVVGYALLGLSLPAALLFASIFASHTLLAYPVVAQRGITGDESVTATIGGTIITDTFALLVLAVVVALAQDQLGPDFWLQLVGGLTAFFFVIWFLLPAFARWVFRRVGEESYFEFLFVMTVLFGSAYAAHAVGVEAIVGAFLAGLALNRLVPKSGPLMNRVEFVGNALFIPFFLLSIGMLVDVRVLVSGPRTLTLAGSMIVMVIVTKYVAAWTTARVYDYSADQLRTMFGLSLGQAAAALAIVLIGSRPDVGLFGEDMLNAVILLILVTSVLSPSIVDRYGSALARQRRESYDPGAAPGRVMVPFSRGSRHRRRLIDLALLVRGEESTEPLYALSVVRPGRDASREIASIEEAFDDVREYGAGADVPVQVQTRVAHNVATGIVRAALENRARTLVLGWDGAASRRQRTIGTVIDQVLARTDQLTLVARVREPLNTTTDVVVLLPPGIGHTEGVLGAVHTIEQLSEQLGAPIRAVAVGGDPDRCRQLFEATEPSVPATFERVEGWSEALSLLETEVTIDQLVIVVSARRDATGWQSSLQTLPRSVATAVPGNVIVVYPAGEGRDDDRQFLRLE